MVFVVSNIGKQLMPTTEYRARKLLKSGRAQIYKHRPFTIMITDREDGETQPIEYKCDTGYQNIGISICSEKHEYVHEERILLKDETERHNDCCKYRKTRRNRKTRYREPRFDNRKGMVAKDCFAPSIRNKRDIHVALFKMYCEVIPITSAIFEMGQFDTQLLKAIEEGKPLPEGKDYQQGERYGIETLREAVFTRDGHKCQICGKTPFKDKVILKVHHIGFWKNDRTNRIGNLLTVCEKCHTPKNHKPEGKLYGLNPRLKQFKGATFMTMVRYDMLKRLKEVAPDVEIHMTYGAKTKIRRKSLNIVKTHANDAYVMGNFIPKHRQRPVCYQKLRRNNRILSKFYDAKYIDIRDGSTKSGQQLSCNRTNRCISRNNPFNERIYHGEKLSKGRCNIRKKHYSLRPGDAVLYNGKWHTVKGIQNNGDYIALTDSKPVKTSKVTNVIHSGGWLKTNSAHPTT